MGKSGVETDKTGFFDIQLHLRTSAESILNSGEIIPRFFNPYSLPIAGLRAFNHELSNPGIVTPREILPEEYSPFIIYDLDDSIWPHAIHVVKAVSEASGLPITMEEFRRYGHTRKVPKWINNPALAKIQDEIQLGRHPIYFPFVNPAWPEAVATIQANDHMGHKFCFLTARQPQLFETTLQVMRWNGIPHNHESSNIDGLTMHPVPQDRELYCAQNLNDVNGYKLAVVKQWLSQLKVKGWKGTMVVVDDLLKPFKELIESKEVLGISLDGDVNASMSPYEGEIRENSWEGIGQRIMEIHQQAVAVDPQPYRVFNCDNVLFGTLLVVNKEEAGFGEFTLDGISKYAFTTIEQWEENSDEVLRRIDIT